MDARLLNAMTSFAVCIAGRALSIAEARAADELRQPHAKIARNSWTPEKRWRQTTPSDQIRYA